MVKTHEIGLRLSKLRGVLGYYVRNNLISEEKSTCLSLSLEFIQRVPVGR